MNIIQHPDGTLQIEDGSRPDGHVKEESTLSYETAEIEQYFIDECERIAEESGETQFLFDTKLSHFVKKRNILNKEDRRESDLSELLENDAYHIGTEKDFSMMPSRFSYYDTETKLKCRYEKYSFVKKFIESLGFEPSEFNLGPEMEQAYILELRENDEIEKFIIRLQPNLFLKLIVQKEGFFHTIYNGFFSKRKIFDAMDQHSGNLSKILIRDAKLKNILS
jgi:hypothetical protein